MLAGQTIGGGGWSVKAQVLVRETVGTVPANAVIEIYLVSNDGSTVLGTLLSAGDRVGTSFDAAFLNKAFADGDALSSYGTLSGGERIVVKVALELGGATLGADFSADFRFGDDAGSFLPEDESTTSDLNPWIEFSKTLFFSSTTVIESTGSASGTGAATGTAAAVSTSVGSSSGVGTATGTAAAVSTSAGSATGAGVATGISAALSAAVGASAGAGAASGVSGVTAGSVGTSIGAGAASGVSGAAKGSVGSSDGVATVSGVGENGAGTVGTAAGTSTVSGVSAAIFASVGSSAGQGTASGSAAARFASVGSAAGSGVASGVSGATKGSVGSAAGVGTATGDAETAGVPTLGAWAFKAEHIDEGTGTLALASITTQTSGGLIVAGVARGEVDNFANPITDNKGNTFNLLDQMRTYTLFPDSGTACYKADPAAGGSGHIIQTVKGLFNGTAIDEVTLWAVEVKNGKRVADIAWNQPAAGSPLTSGSVTVSGSAVLIAIWWGDTYGSDSTLSVGDGFTLLATELRSSEQIIQCGLAYKEVGAGTHSVTWTETPDQGAQLWLIAVDGIEDQVVSATDGSASGTGTATGVAAARFAVVGSAAGVSSANGVAASLFAVAASSSGTATVAGVGCGLAQAVGSATGVGTMVGAMATVKAAAGSAAGAGAVSGAAAQIVATVGAGAGLGSASGDALFLFAFVGFADGIGAASGVSGAIKGAIGTAVGTSSAIGSATVVGEGLSSEALGYYAVMSDVDAWEATFTDVVDVEEP